MAKVIKKKQLGVGELKVSAQAIKLVNQVLQSSRLSYGPFHRSLERMFARAHDVKYSIFTNSGTSALQIALHALKSTFGWKDGDEVIVPAITFVATANIVIACRMKPVFVDVDPQTFNIDPKLIQKAITPKTRCIIPVHLLGLPADMAPIMKIAKQYRLKVIEDSCETMFAHYKGKKVGSIGDIGCFSTYTAHFLVTGVGGFATTNDRQLSITMRSLMNHGRDPIYLTIDDDKVSSPDRLRKVIAKRFRFVDIGYSYRCTELEAALGVAQMKERNKIIRGRRKNALYLTRRLKKLESKLQLPSTFLDRDNMFMLYGLVVKDEPKTELINFLEQRGIETRELFPLVNQPVYERLFGPGLEDRFPVAKFLNRHAFYIGCHEYFTQKDLDYIIQAFFDYSQDKRPVKRGS
ncbi:MAG: DegT/DnrJ/EryC1/StrS family aminotransferase [Candidatus Omnitrophota bacterium]